ncbi:ESX-1 secretion-associated protein [Micromonospora globispora]|uniref:ESX-1 secretion-associated protein n=1 Tax=Micromonospora globispora TaxID=1450148 RepID=A0A317JSL7_9ACTN|nr:type VII secretion target [Micromonospora globispora]PWU43340.1 ESX-1 secretion-associated protein [Micromonospora globispora]PWU56647.1 ESX-1 secretion-associated protein [Micromonospora globispora]RQX01157.1 ESX-1 secretion-associated protein [Micromonospora globispora]
MVAGEGIQVSPADLTAHAGHLDAIADAVTVARQAGQSVRLGADAYGQLCVMMPLLLDQVQRILVDGVDTAAHSVGDTADRLRAVAGRYQDADARAETMLNRIRQRL